MNKVFSIYVEDLVEHIHFGLKKFLASLPEIEKDESKYQYSNQRENC